MATFTVQTAYGTETFKTLLQAKTFARMAAAITGKATTVVKHAEAADRVRAYND